MIDQLRINDKYSYDDFEASIRERKIGEPEKKKIKDTVPFSNATYDFSAINGEVYWEERKLEYIFEILADTPEELEEKKRRFLTWIMFVQEQELHDPFITGYHFNATFDGVSVDDSEIEKATITATFTTYPYVIANNETVYVVSIDAGTEKAVSIINDSAHRIIPTLAATKALVIKKNNSSFAIPAGTLYDETFDFTPGKNDLIVQNPGTEKSTITITFRVEVM